MICKKCGSEFDGNVCPNCESYCDTNTGNFKAKDVIDKKYVALIVIVILAILVAVCVPVVVTILNNDFRAEKVDKINIGDTQEQVVKILGEPYAKDEYQYEYYINTYTEQTSEGEQINYLAGSKYIRVEFDGDGKVSSVFLDANKSEISENGKDVSSYKLVTDSVTRFVPTDVVYSVKFIDGSFYKGVAVKDFIATYSDKTNVSWVDKWKNNYQKLINVKENPDIVDTELGGDNIWCAVDKNDVMTVYGNGLMNRELYNRYEYVKQIVVCEGVTGISESAFRGLSALKSVSLPSTLTSIGDHAFEYCTALESVTISDNIMKVGDYAFFGCNNLTVFCKAESQPDGWAKEWNNSKRPVVWDCAQSGKTEDGIKWGLNNDGQMIVAGYSGISSVLEIPSTIEGYAVDDICESAFRENQTIKTVRIANGIKSIGDSAFEQCGNMTSVKIPLGVESVGIELFSGCNANLTIYCEYATALRAWWSVLSWNDYKVVWGYNNITSDVDFDYIVRDGKAYLTKYKGEETSVIIPQTIGGVEVVSIGEVFYNNDTLTDVTIAGVVRLDKYAFMGCSALRSVTFADDRLTSIGDYAFNSCKNLTDIVIPASVTEIGQYAFFDCISLQEVAFANTDGWYVTDYKDSTDGVDMDVTDVSRNATRLSSDYYYRFYWKRNGR